MLRKSTRVLLAIVLLLMTVATASAITFGEPDGDGHPYVGILYFEQASGLWRCTGTLISPTVLLTAGHCTEEFGVPNSNSWVSFEPEITFEGIDINNDEEFIEYLNTHFLKGTAIPHPQYDDFSEFPNTYDVGVVILDEPVYLDEYGALPELGLLETLTKGQNRKDRQFTAVGYGLQGYVPAFYHSERTRYAGTVSLIEVKSTYNGDGQGAKFSNNPGQGNGTGGTCFGDSGGPLFHGESNVIGAIVSWGITPCIGVDYQFRIDTSIALDFVNQYLQ